MNKQCWMLAAMAVAAMLTGCGPKGRPSDNLLISADAADQLDYRVQWQQSLALPKHVAFMHVEPMGDVLATVDTSRMLSLVQADDGKVRWSTKLGTRAQRITAPRRGDGWVTVSAESTAFVYQLTSGDLLRKIELAHVAATTPAIDGPFAVYGSPTGVVFAQDLARGIVAWEYKLTGGIVTDVIRAENTIIACDANGSVAAFNPTRGNLLWRRVAPPWRRVSATPVGNESFVYVASEDQALYGFERTTGRFWKYLTESALTTSPVIIADRVFQDVPSEGIVCLDAYTGDVIWRSGKTHGRVVMMTKNELVLVAQPNRLVLLDSETGEAKGVIDLPKADRVIADATLAGNLYLANDKGQLLKLSPK